MAKKKRKLNIFGDTPKEYIDSLIEEARLHSPPDFSDSEFTGQYKISKLCKALGKSGIRVIGDSVDGLNKILV